MKPSFEIIKPEPPDLTSLSCSLLGSSSNGKGKLKKSSNGFCLLLKGLILFWVLIVLMTLTFTTAGAASSTKSEKSG